jgi:hypothetical protein
MAWARLCSDGAGRPVAFKRLSVSHRKSILYGAFVWARRALNGQKRWFPARAEDRVALARSPRCPGLDPWAGLESLAQPRPSPCGRVPGAANVKEPAGGGGGGGGPPGARRWRPTCPLRYPLGPWLPAWLIGSDHPRAPQPAPPPLVSQKRRHSTDIEFALSTGKAKGPPSSRAYLSGSERV